MKKWIAAALSCALALSPVAPAVMLSGCASGTTASSLATVVNDVSSIATGLSAALPGLAAAGIPADKLAQVQSAIAQIQTIAAEVKNVTDMASAKPMVQQLEVVLNGLVGVAASIPGLPPSFSVALSAASILLPVIENAVGMTVMEMPAPADVAHARTVRAH